MLLLGAREGRAQHGLARLRGEERVHEAVPGRGRRRGHYELHVGKVHRGRHRRLQGESKVDLVRILRLRVLRHPSF